METRKIDANDTTELIYVFADDTKVAIHPGEQGVSEMDIKTVKLMRNNEVYNNIKNGKPGWTEKEKAEAKAYEESHPGEEVEKKWNDSIESIIGKDGKSFTDSFPMSNPFRPSDAMLENKQQVVEDALNALKPEQRMIIRMKYWEERPQQEIAAELGISNSALSQRIKTILRTLKKKIEKISAEP